MEVQYAQRFALWRRGADWRVEVRLPAGDSVRRYRYTFLSIEGIQKQGPLNGDTLLTPVQRLACFSATHVGAVEALGAVDRLVATTDTAWLYSAAARQRVRSGRAVGLREPSTETERLLAQRPDLVMVSASGVAESDAHQKLQELGLRVMLNADWLESHPLGRAEWVRVFGVMLGRVEAADSLFARVAARYDSLRQVAMASARPRTTVLTGRHWKGVWYVPGGRSFAAVLLRDAGFAYPWAADTNTGSLPLAPELVLKTAGTAEVWLNHDELSSRKALLAEDARYGQYAAFRSGRLFNKTLRTTPSGGNDFWELGMVRPDLLLEDLIAIGQPELLPGHRFTFYQRFSD